MTALAYEKGPGAPTPRPLKHIPESLPRNSGGSVTSLPVPAHPITRLRAGAAQWLAAVVEAVNPALVPGDECPRHHEPVFPDPYSGGVFCPARGEKYRMRPAVPCPGHPGFELAALGGSGFGSCPADGMSYSMAGSGVTPCGAVHDRDVNAAENMLALGRRESLNACGGDVRPGQPLAVAGEAGTRRSASTAGPASRRPVCLVLPAGRNEEQQ